MECCSTKNNAMQRDTNTKNICTSCNRPSNKVEYKTILLMLKYPQIKKADKSEYFYCTNPNCDVIYFSNELRLIFNKNDVRLRIGIKETSEVKLVCYCFDITEKQIKDEIKLTGKCTIPNFITEKIQSKFCACNIKNPSGKCCLGNVKKIVNSNI